MTIKCVSGITKLNIHHKAYAVNDEAVLEMQQVKGEQLQPMDTTRSHVPSADVCLLPANFSRLTSAMNAPLKKRENSKRANKNVNKCSI